ncbi:MAG: hypothetical protein EOM36_01735 [Bacteroidia bacterium]|nr:hypothetical protein [Bacteroidia bacterium]
MDPFRIPNELTAFSDPYPAAQLLIDTAKKGGESARTAISRLWLSEGIPYAFRGCPAIYEAIRTWLSLRIDVEAKEITIAGSGRLGQSLSPRKLGNPFNEMSDLDLVIVSTALFNKLRTEFLSWSFDYENSNVMARNPTEESYWADNNSRGQKLLQRGFLDQNMIPNFDNYPTTQCISSAMYLLVEKLKVTKNSPTPKKASIRCYKSWDSFVKQLCINLE